jgi:hypothetical protein
MKRVLALAVLLMITGARMLYEIAADRFAPGYWL